MATEQECRQKARRLARAEQEAYDRYTAAKENGTPDWRPLFYEWFAARHARATQQVPR